MVRWCVVKKCHNKTKGKMRDGITLHKFPRTPDLLQKWEEWVNAVNGLCDPLMNRKKFKAYNGALLCSYHFDPSCFKFGLLQCDSVPSVPSASVTNVVLSPNELQNEEIKKEIDASDPQRIRKNIPPVKDEWSCTRDRNSIMENTCETLHEIIMDAPSETYKLSPDTVSIFEPTVIISTDDPIDQSESCIEDAKITYRNKDDSIADKMSQRLRRKCYVGDLTEEDFMTPRRRQRSLHIVQTHLKKAKERIKKMNERNRRLYKQNIKLYSMLRKLEENGYLVPGLSEMLQVNYKRFLSNKRFL